MADRASRGHSHLRQNEVFELFVDANLFVFQGAAGITVSINLPLRRAAQEHRTPCQ